MSSGTATVGEGDLDLDREEGQGVALLVAEDVFDEDVLRLGGRTGDRDTERGCRLDSRLGR